jgi:phospholipase/carboxylesterase
MVTGTAACGRPFPVPSFFFARRYHAPFLRGPASDVLELIEHETSTAPDSAVVWLHGLGADGHDFEPVVAELDLPRELGLRFIFPHAPFRPVTLNQGYVMRAWFDILGLDPQAPQDEEGLSESERALRELIERERARGIAPERIILAGFSQGGAVALHTGLRYPEPLSGLLALSTWLPDRDATAEAGSIPREIFMAHGALDPVVRVEWARASRDHLLAQGHPLQWREYPRLAHGVDLAELADLRQWLIDRLADNRK